jgi:L-aspartate oxidase
VLVRRVVPPNCAVCRHHAIQLPHELSPLAPAAHYSCGGVATDLEGRTSLPGLYAAGEVAWTGVHGANRLASNSLLECVVFGHRLARILEAHQPQVTPRAPFPAVETVYGFRDLLPALAWAKIGLLRDDTGLGEALETLATWTVAPVPGVAQGEARNLVLAATLIATAARWRQESRGCHFRLDYPEANDLWLKHFTQTPSRPSHS